VSSTALYLFTIALISTLTIGLQNYIFAAAAATLTTNIRSLSFRAILRQDSKFVQCDYNFLDILSNSRYASKLNSLTKMSIALEVLLGA
jgi:ATP-binding cassette subfamily B (MDR/TAP) protein 1